MLLIRTDEKIIFWVRFVLDSRKLIKFDKKTLRRFYVYESVQYWNYVDEFFEIDTLKSNIAKNKICVKYTESVEGEKSTFIF